MIDPHSDVALRRARESAQSVEPTVYDAPPGEPDVYAEEAYPSGFGPKALPPDRLFQFFPISLAGSAVEPLRCSWDDPEYLHVMLDKSAAGAILTVSSTEAVTGRPMAIIGQGGYAKIPVNGLQRVIYLIAGAAAACNGVAVFTRGCDYICIYSS